MKNEKENNENDENKNETILTVAETITVMKHEITILLLLTLLSIDDIIIDMKHENGFKMKTHMQQVIRHEIDAPVQAWVASHV